MSKTKSAGPNSVKANELFAKGIKPAGGLGAFPPAPSTPREVGLQDQSRPLHANHKKKKKVCAAVPWLRGGETGPQDGRGGIELRCARLTPGSPCVQKKC